MICFVGLDVSVKETAVCIVDDTGKVTCEQQVPTEPDDIVTQLIPIGDDYGRVGVAQRHAACHCRRRQAPRRDSTPHVG